MPNAKNSFLSFLSGLQAPAITSSTQPVSPFISTAAKKKVSSIPSGPMSYITPSNTGATAAAPAKVATPAKTPALNSAQSVNQKLGIGEYYPGGPTALNAAVTKENADRNSYLGSLGSDTSSYSAGFDSGFGTEDTPSTKKSNSGMDAYTKAFDDYINSLKPSDELTNAQTNLGQISNQIMRRGLDARRSYEALLGRDGGTVQGARESAALDSRHSNSDLADLAIQQDAAANTVTALSGNQSALTAAQKARVEFAKSLLPETPEGFTLGKDQVRYDAEGNVVAGNAGASDTGGLGYTPGADPTTDAWIKLVNGGQAKLTDVPEDYKAGVAQGLSATPKGQTQGSKKAVSIIDELLGLDTNAIAGIPSILTVAGLSNQTAVNKAKQLQGILSLEGRNQLKGSGAISDFEFKVLEQAASALGIDSKTGRSNLNNSDFKAALQDLKKELQTTAGGIMPDEEDYLRSKNYSEEEIQALKQEGFSTVGGDTKKASKIVGGYDIGSYATDPNHEARVASIYSKVKPIATTTQADQYIRTVAPNSPVKGQDVVDAARAFSVSVPMILAIMQQDSTFGTAGLAVRTKNPGNVGNTDSGATRTYNSWRDGVYAVARNLSGRKVA